MARRVKTEAWTNRKSGGRTEAKRSNLRQLNRPDLRSRRQPPAVRPAVAIESSKCQTRFQPTGGKRKRCPKCNAIYNGDLVSYCAHHIVPLVDVDEPIITDPPPKSNPPLFWIIVLVTLTGSIVMGSIISTYLYARTRRRLQAQPAPTIQKGLPELDADLVGKAVSLPEAECPLSGS